MIKKIEDRAVAIAAAIAEQMKALDKGAPVMVMKEKGRKGRLELPNRLSLGEGQLQLFGPGTAHNNNN